MGPRFGLSSDDERAGFNDKRWTIMAALLGTNTAMMLFQGIQQEVSPNSIREIALVIIGICLPFQAIYFMIHTYVIEYSDAIGRDQHRVLQRLSALCQVIAYMSLSGVILLWYNMSKMVGIAFTLSALIAIVLIRLAMSQAESLEKERTESD
ncbi:MAG TPA: hypothetical protein EYQ73_01870 [Candidatus Poseidoniales archaeon]|jgi:hypothetical protein|nr:MAG: hypothetical protein CXT71_06745 [Euryarchaeota archaeon]HIF45527.1 hypothetical protein [Candidatus Poseidoniales archaeon]HIL65185.1 hypothetical protein [Candidatus Poseidoniales archaeon]